MLDSEVVLKMFFESSLMRDKAYSADIIHKLCTEILSLRGVTEQAWTVRKDVSYPINLNVCIVSERDYKPDVSPYHV